MTTFHRAEERRFWARGPFANTALVRRFLLSLVIFVCIVNNFMLHENTKSHYLQVLLSSSSGNQTEQYHSLESNDDASIDDFPTTRFTSHVNQVVELYEFDGIQNCDNEYTFTVTSQEAQIPTISCRLNPFGKGINPVSKWWCKILKQTFAKQQRTIPHNVSLAFSTMDFLDEVDMYSCVGSSAHQGNFSMMNFKEIERMYYQEEFEVKKSWDQRHTIPIWRGTPWIDLDQLNYDNTDNEDEIYKQVLSLSPRLKAVDWSLRHPSLLDARVHQSMEEMEYDNNSIWKTNSNLHKLLKRSNIPEDDYYTQYQATLILCGLGASFRTPIFMSTATAIVLQECDYHEWFTPMLVPFTHYIPLKQDLGDLEERMMWIQNHPEQVLAIAQQGRDFYNDYLSFERNEEHIYEFVYRLSLARAKYEKTLSPRQRKKLQVPAHGEVAPMETISMNDDRIGNVEELETMCQELLLRAGDAEEGEEPWRDTGGLTWRMNDCADQADSVLGNHLSRWYMIRAVASDAGIAVEMPCRSAVTDRIQTNVSPFDTRLDGGFKFSWRDFCQSCETNDEPCRYPHSIRANGLERIRSVISEDLRTMAYKVISEKPQLVNELDDVTIHLRCGDIGRQDHTLYGLVPFRSYKSLIPKNPPSIGIVTAPFEQDREGWGPGDPQLNEAVATAARAYLQEHFPNATVSIRNSEKDTLDMVYARLILTNTTICGPSTFCVYPAIASLGQSYILQSPLFGGYPTWLSRVATARTFRNVHYVPKRYFPSIDLYKLSTTDIVNKLAGKTRRRPRPRLG